MNLFSLSSLCSIIAGAAVGIKIAETVSWSEAACFVSGLLLGYLGYAVALAPGIALMWLAQANGAEPSRMSSVGGWLIMLGAFMSPLIAFYLAQTLFAASVAWLL